MLPRPDTIYDKRGDGCRRVGLGLLLSLFVVAALFGSVCSFVTNYYTYSGAQQVTTRMGASLEDASLYLQHTDQSFDTLLVTNFQEMEEVVTRVLEESGGILTRKLTNVTEASALGSIHSLVTSLPRVRSGLKEIRGDIRELEDQVNQLVSGLAKSQKNLGAALTTCRDHTACRSFTGDYKLSEDLVVLKPLLGLSFTSSNHGINNAVSEISDLLENGLVGKVTRGVEQLASLEARIQEEVSEVAPGVRAGLRSMGAELKERAGEVRLTLGGIDVEPLKADLPKLDEMGQQWVEYRFYVGLGMASTLLLILICLVLGLFYGFCGKRPGGLYGDDCCNRGTGASFLLLSAHLTFIGLSALPVVLLTTAHFLLGSTLHQVVCSSLQHPGGSDVWRELDQTLLTPTLSHLLGESAGGRGGRSAEQVIRDCHANKTLYDVLGLEQVYNISSLSSWRTTWGLDAPLGRLGEADTQGLQALQLLAPDVRKDLEQLEDSPLASLDFSQFGGLSEDEVTKVDLQKLVRKLRTLRQQLGWQEAMRGTANQLELEVRWLEGMTTVGEQLKLMVRRLQARLAQLEKDGGVSGQASLGPHLSSLLAATARAEETLDTSGPSLLQGLARQLALETEALVDSYVLLTEAGVRTRLGACAPLSEAFNATVSAVCQEVVLPFNGFWASCGWCFLLYLPCVLLSVSLIKLYR